MHSGYVPGPISVTVSGSPESSIVPTAVEPVRIHSITAVIFGIIAAPTYLVGLTKDADWLHKLEPLLETGAPLLETGATTPERVLAR